MIILLFSYRDLWHKYLAKWVFCFKTVLNLNSYSFSSNLLHTDWIILLPVTLASTTLLFRILYKNLSMEPSTILLIFKAFYWLKTTNMDTQLQETQICMGTFTIWRHSFIHKCDLFFFDFVDNPKLWLKEWPVITKLRLKRCELFELFYVSPETRYFNAIQFLCLFVFSVEKNWLMGKLIKIICIDDKQYINVKSFFSAIRLEWYEEEILGYLGVLFIQFYQPI